MSIFLWILFVFLGIYWVFRLFGKQIFTLAMRSVLKRMEKNVDEQKFNYYKNYDTDPFRDQVYVDEDIKVSIPKHREEKKVNMDEIAEEVEFDDVN